MSVPIMNINNNSGKVLNFVFNEIFQMENMMEHKTIKSVNGITHYWISKCVKKVL